MLILRCLLLCGMFALPIHAQPLAEALRTVDTAEAFPEALWQVEVVEVTQPDLAVAWRLMTEPMKTDTIGAVDDAAVLLAMRPVEERLFSLTVLDLDNAELAEGWVGLAQTMTQAMVDEANASEEEGPKFEGLIAVGDDTVPADAAARVRVTMLVPGSAPASVVMVRAVRETRVVELLAVNVSLSLDDTAAWLEAGFALEPEAEDDDSQPAE